MSGWPGARVRHVARWLLAALAVFAFGALAAQSPRRTTVGRLLGGRVDTIEVKQRHSGELGWRGAELRLVRVDSGYTGTLHWQSGVILRMDGTARQCDTTMTAFMTQSAARRLFALLGPAVIEPGEAPPGIPVRDAQNDHSYRLTSGPSAVVVDKGSALMHGATRYRTPPRRDRNGRRQTPWPHIDANTPLMKALDTLETYLQLDRSIEFSKGCSR